MARPWKRRSVLALATGVLLGGISVSEAIAASSGWCRREPVVKIGDKTAHIFLSSYKEMNDLATGATKLVITVPEGVPTRYVADDPGFGHLGYDVRFAESDSLRAKDGAVEVVVESFTPAADSLPVVLEFTAVGDGTPVSERDRGEANAWLRVRVIM